ncbi:MAG: hypothetical protein R3D25_06245 [Geminicoccaceae bacterium]
MVVVKTASNFQYFLPIASGVIRVDTRGPGQSDIATLPSQCASRGRSTRSTRSLRGADVRRTACHRLCAFVTSRRLPATVDRPTPGHSKREMSARARRSTSQAPVDISAMCLGITLAFGLGTTGKAQEGGTLRVVILRDVSNFDPQSFPLAELSPDQEPLRQPARVRPG